MAKSATYCPTCGQRMRETKYKFSRNAVQFLSEFARALAEGKKGYVETSKVYDFQFKGSRTAELTQMKYFGVIRPYYSTLDEQSDVKNSGKWTLTILGEKFLRDEKQIPTRITVFNQKVISRDDPKRITDPSLKWFKQALHK